jgi:hypothetical protein
VTVAVRGGAPDLLGTAAALARSMQAQLAGLFVEDVTLLRVAALPVTREVGRVSGVARAFDVPELERMLRRQAEQLRQVVAEVAQAASLPWSFEVRRGDLLEQALSLLEPAHLVVLGRAAPEPRAAPAELAGVTAWLDAADPELRALEVALRLAGDRPLLLLLAGAQGALPQLRARVEAQLESGGARSTTIRAATQGAVGELGSAAASRHRALVLGPSPIRTDRKALKALVEAQPGLLVLVG